MLSNSPSPVKASDDDTVHKDMSLSMFRPGSVYVVDPEMASMVGDWDNEHGIVAMRKYCALRDEAHETVEESRKIWVDTPFSIFAMQCKSSCHVEQTALD